jgi:hypothetical protein
MAYTTVAEVKKGLVYRYWKEAKRKLAEDGFAYDEDANSFTDEAVFLQTFVDRQAEFIDAYAKGPFAANSVLDDINRTLALYAVEEYVVSARGDRQINISIVSEKKRVMKLLEQVRDGDIGVEQSDPPEDAAPDLVEDTSDGVTLTLGDLEENILMYGASDADTIPE